MAYQTHASTEDGAMLLRIRFTWGSTVALQMAKQINCNALTIVGMLKYILIKKVLPRRQQKKEKGVWGGWLLRKGRTSAALKSILYSRNFSRETFLCTLQINCKKISSSHWRLGTQHWDVDKAFVCFLHIGGNASKHLLQPKQSSNILSIACML